MKGRPTPLIRPQASSFRPCPRSGHFVGAEKRVHRQKGEPRERRGSAPVARTGTQSLKLNILGPCQPRKVTLDVGPASELPNIRTNSPHHDLVLKMLFFAVS